MFIKRRYVYCAYGTKSGREESCIFKNKTNKGNVICIVRVYYSRLWFEKGIKNFYQLVRASTLSVRITCILTHAILRFTVLSRCCWYQIVCLLYVNRNECGNRVSCSAVMNTYERIEHTWTNARPFGFQRGPMAFSRHATAETFRNGPVGTAVLLLGPGWRWKHDLETGQKENLYICVTDYGREQRATRAAEPGRTAY